MLADWLIYTIFIFIILYLTIMLFYTKALYEKEKKSSAIKQQNIKDAQLLIRKYRVQLQRAIGDIDILTEELNKVRNDIKTLRARNSQQRLENDQLTQKIKELEERIEALI